MQKGLLICSLLFYSFNRNCFCTFLHSMTPYGWIPISRKLTKSEFLTSWMTAIAFWGPCAPLISFCCAFITWKMTHSLRLVSTGLCNWIWLMRLKKLPNFCLQIARRKWTGCLAQSWTRSKLNELSAVQVNFKFYFSLTVRFSDSVMTRICEWVSWCSN